MVPAAVVALVLAVSAAAQNSVDIGAASTGGGNPVAAQFGLEWTLDSDYDEVELTFQLIRNGNVIAGSGAFYYQSSGSDTFVIQFGATDAKVGDKVRVTAKFTGNGQTTVWQDDTSLIN